MSTSASDNQPPKKKRAPRAKAPAAPAPLEQAVYAPTLGYAGFWRRAAAALIDTCVLWLGLWFLVIGLGFMGIITLPFGLLFVAPLSWLLLGGGMLLGVMFFTFAVAPWFYGAFFLSSSWQATPGMRALDIKVVDEEGQRITFGRASLRFVGAWISGLIFYIGYFMILFTDRKQALHDKIAKTLVVKV